MKFRLLCAVTAMILLFSSLCLTAYAAVGGDINGDGKLANDDVTVLVSFLSGKAPSVKIANLDADNNGKINNRDAIAIVQALAGWEVTLYTGIGSDGSDIDVSELR